jgi:hypothetical protein
MVINLTNKTRPGIFTIIAISTKVSPFYTIKASNLYTLL